MNLVHKGEKHNNPSVFEHVLSDGVSALSNGQTIIHVKKVIRPQDTLCKSNFSEIVSYCSGVQLEHCDNKIAYKRRSIIYSSEYYSSLTAQYFIGYAGTKYLKHYFVKMPSNSEDEIWSRYRASFRRNVRKSLKNRLGFEVIQVSKSFSDAVIKSLYSIHLSSVHRIKTYALPFKLFKSLFFIEGITPTLCLVKDSFGNISSFQLLIGNIAYVSGVSDSGVTLKASNYLSHQLNIFFSDEIIYMGTGFIGSGIEYFKKASGTVAIPCTIIPHSKILDFSSYLTLSGIYQSIGLGKLCNLYLKKEKSILTFLPYS